MEATRPLSLDLPLLRRSICTPYIIGDRCRSSLVWHPIIGNSGSSFLLFSIDILLLLLPPDFQCSGSGAAGHTLMTIYGVERLFPFLGG